MLYCWPYELSGNLSYIVFVHYYLHYTKLWGQNQSASPCADFVLYSYHWILLLFVCNVKCLESRSYGWRRILEFRCVFIYFSSLSSMFFVGDVNMLQLNDMFSHCKRRISSQICRLRDQRTNDAVLLLFCSIRSTIRPTDFFLVVPSHHVSCTFDWELIPACITDSRSL